MSHHEVIKFIDASSPSKKVDLMFKINEERGFIPSEFFSILRHKETKSPSEEAGFSKAIHAMGFESPDTFMAYIKPILD